MSLNVCKTCGGDHYTDRCPLANFAEPFRIPGDALELMKYELEKVLRQRDDAYDRIQELEYNIAAILEDASGKKCWEEAVAENKRLFSALLEDKHNHEVESAALHALIEALEQEVEHYSQMAFNLGVKCGGLEQEVEWWKLHSVNAVMAYEARCQELKTDRDSWRAKAGGRK